MLQSWADFPFGFAVAQARLDKDALAYAEKSDPEDTWTYDWDADDTPARDQPTHQRLGVRLADHCACLYLRESGALLTPCTSHSRPPCGTQSGALSSGS